MTICSSTYKNKPMPYNNTGLQWRIQKFRLGERKHCLCPSLVSFYPLPLSLSKIHLGGMGSVVCSWSGSGRSQMLFCISDHFDIIPACDRRTDERTDRQTLDLSLAISEIFSVKESPEAWNLGLGLFKVIENGAVRQSMHDFLLVRHCNCSFILYRFRVIWRRIMSWPWNLV